MFDGDFNLTFKNSVGGDCHHTILNPIFTIESWLNNLSYIGAMAIAPYGDLNA